MKGNTYQSALLMLALSSSLSVSAYAAASFSITTGTTTIAQTLGANQTGSVSSGAELNVSSNVSPAITVT